MMNGVMRLIINRGERNLISYVILLVTVFIVFTSLNKESFGTECIAMTVVLILLNTKAKNVVTIIPFMVAMGSVLLILLLSGKYFERGFNAPISHALKFVSLAFVVTLSNVMQGLPNKKKLIVLKTAFLSIGLSAVISLYKVVFVNKYAIRYAQDMNISWVVDFNQFYSICLLLCIMVFTMISLYNDYKIRKYLFFCLLLAGVVLLSLITTGMLLCVLGIVLGIIIRKYTQSKTRFVLMAILAFGVLCLVFLFRNSISDWIYNVTESTNWIVRGRLRSAVDMLLGTHHNNEYNYSRREELMGYSLSTFRDNPLCGVGYKGYGYGIIGCHQEWPDMLGVFGIVGMVIFVGLISIFVRHVKKSIVNKIDLQSFRIALLLFIVLGFLNPCISMPTLCMVFIIAPNISIIFKWWKKQQNNTIQYGNGNRNCPCL